MGVNARDADQMIMDGEASDAEIVAMGKALRDAVSRREAAEMGIDYDEDTGSFVEVVEAENVELFPNGVPV
jgi:hypothetical protein